MVSTGDSRVKTVPRIRCPNSTLSFLSVQSQCISGNVFAPKSFIESIAQCRCLGLESGGFAPVAQNQRKVGRSAFSCIDISLHFAKRDWAFRQPSVCVKHRI